MTDVKNTKNRKYGYVFIYEEGIFGEGKYMNMQFCVYMLQ